MKTLKISKLVLVLMISLVTGITGCWSLGGGGWLEQLKTNPVLGVERALSEVAQVLRVADLVWGLVKPLLPAGQQPSVEAKYRQLKLGVESAAGALSGALEAAKRGGEKSPDLAGYFDALLKASQDLQTFLGVLKGQAGVGAGGGDVEAGYEALGVAVGNLSSAAVKR
jgi:hypothetical protein